MARLGYPQMPLSARQVETLKAQDKPYKVADGGGLFLHVTSKGNKSWRLKYRFNGKEKLMTFGLYPAVSLAEARSQRDQAKTLLSTGIDPSKAKKARHVESLVNAGNTFRAIAKEWHASRCKTWSEKYSNEIISMFETDIFPCIGDDPIVEIKPLVLLEVLRKFEERGAMERARKARRRCGEVFKYAIVTGRALYNPAPDLSIAMSSPKSKHYPFLSESEVGEFNRALAGYSGGVIVRLATQLLQITGLRTVELRYSKWSFIDFEHATWEIPSELMKSRKPHIVPLSIQALELLQQAKMISGHGQFIFPGRSDKNKPISENSILGVIRRIGFEGRASGHGFRHQMSTILNEHGFDSDLIERQLAHVDRNKIRGIYNHAQYLEKRRDMMQWYANYIDNL